MRKPNAAPDRPRCLRAMLLLLIGAAIACASTAAAQGPWPVKGKLLGKQDKKAEDVSGIACNAPTGLPRTCLLVDDESQGAQIVIVKEGEIVAGQFIRLIDDQHAAKPLELDGEGVAYAGDAFYVIGSHGHPRDKDKKLDKVKDAPLIAASIKANSRVIRVKFDAAAVDQDGKLKTAAEIRSSAELARFLAADPVLKPFVNQRLDENGLTVEGVAVRDARLYAAMRGPALKGGEQAILSVAVAALFDGAPADARLHLLKLGADRGIRDLVAFGSGFLVLAGPSAEADGLYSIFFWDGEKDAKLLADMQTFNEGSKQLKAEAILPLDRSGQELRVLVLFDGPDEGEPRPVRIPHP